MKLNLLTRRVHYWAAAASAIPLAVIVATGLLLQVKKQVPWVQPPERRGVGGEPKVSFAQVLATCLSVPKVGIRTWGDVARLDLRPSRGTIKVTAASGWEVQLDAATGDVLQVAYRRSDAIEALHDGSWFHDAVKYWVFLPAGLTLLLLWATGLYLFALPYVVRWKRAGHDKERARREAGARPPTTR